MLLLQNLFDLSAYTPEQKIIALVAVVLAVVIVVGIIIAVACAAKKKAKLAKLDESKQAAQESVLNEQEQNECKENQVETENIQPVLEKQEETTAVQVAEEVKSEQTEVVTEQKTEEVTAQPVVGKAAEEVQEESKESASTTVENDFSFVAQKGESLSVSFEAKISTAPQEIKDSYCELVNYALSYNKVKRRASWTTDKIYSGRTLLFTLKMNGKTLGAYFALDPKDYADTKIPVKDMSGKKSYAEVPLMIKVKSSLSLKRAKSLVDDVMNKNGFVKGTAIIALSPDDFPAASVEELIEQGKIKRR